MKNLFQIIFAVASIGLLYLLLGFHTDPHDYGANTRTRLKYAKLGVAILEDVSKKPIVDSMIESSPYLSVGFLSFSNAFFRYKSDLVENTNSNLNVYLLDGWGSPLNVDILTNVIRQNDPRWSNLTNYGIVVWSSGANRVDDRCTGDDMVWMVDDHL